MVNGILLRKKLLRYFQCKEKIVVVEQTNNGRNGDDNTLLIQMYFRLDNKPSDEDAVKLKNDVLKIIEECRTDI